MITLTRLSGQAFVLNSDLVERVDATPDSVITLVDGKKYVVKESLEEIIDAVREYRSTIVAVSSMLADQSVEQSPSRGAPKPATLAPVPNLPSIGDA